MSISDAVDANLAVFVPWLCVAGFLLTYSTIIFFAVMVRKIQTSKNTESYEAVAARAAQIVDENHIWVVKGTNTYVRDATMKEVLSRQGRWNEAAMVNAVRARDRRLTLFIFFFYCVFPVALGNGVMWGIGRWHYLEYPVVLFSAAGILAAAAVIIIRTRLFALQDVARMLPDLQGLVKEIDKVSAVSTVAAFVAGLVAFLGTLGWQSLTVTILPALIPVGVIAFCTFGQVYDLRVVRKEIRGALVVALVAQAAQAAQTGKTGKPGKRG